MPEPSAAARLLYRVNRASLFRRRLRVFGTPMRASSADRLLALALTDLGLLAGAERRIFEALIRPGDRVVDVGANLGVFTLLASRSAGPGGEVFALEPEPSLADLLEENVEGARAANVRVLRLAAGAARGRATLACSPVNSGDNRLDPGFAAPGVEVEVAPLDELVGGEVDFVKIDVQGREADVLAGMRGLLGRSPRARLLLEYSPDGLERCGASGPALLGSLRSLGFQLFEAGRGGTLAPVDEGRLARLRGYFGYTNLLASRDLPAQLPQR